MPTFWDMTISAYWAWSAWTPGTGRSTPPRARAASATASPRRSARPSANRHRPVLAVSGDGGAMYSIAELATAKQHNAGHLADRGRRRLRHPARIHEWAPSARPRHRAGPPRLRQAGGILRRAGRRDHPGDAAWRSRCGAGRAGSKRRCSPDNIEDVRTDSRDLMRISIWQTGDARWLRWPTRPLASRPPAGAPSAAPDMSPVPGR